MLTKIVTIHSYHNIENFLERIFTLFSLAILLKTRYNSKPSEGEKAMLVNHKILENLCKDAGEKRTQKARAYQRLRKSRNLSY